MKFEQSVLWQLQESVRLVWLIRDIITVFHVVYAEPFYADKTILQVSLMSTAEAGYKIGYLP